MAIVIVAESTLSTANAVDPHDHTGITVPSGTELLLAAIGTNGPATMTFTAVTWDFGGSAQVMDQIIRGDSATSGDGMTWFGLMAPTVGNLTLRVDMNGPRDIYVYCFALTGIDTTDLATAIENESTQQGTADPAAIAVTNPSGNLSFVGLVPTAVDPVSVSGATQEALSTAANNINFAVSSSASVNPTHSWDLSASGEWVAAFLSVKVAVSATATPIVPRHVIMRARRRNNKRRAA